MLKCPYNNIFKIIGVKFMKKIISFVLALTIIVAFGVSASAATITDVSVTEDRIVNFEFDATNYVVGETQIAVEIHPVSADGTALQSEDIAYINQFTYDGTNASTANLADNFARGTFTLKVNATNETADAENFIEYVYGDVVCDGDVNAADILTLAKYIAGYQSTVAEFNERATTVADVTHDDAITSADLLKVVRYFAQYGDVTTLDK